MRQPQPAPNPYGVGMKAITRMARMRTRMMMKMEARMSIRTKSWTTATTGPWPMRRLPGGRLGGLRLYRGGVGRLCLCRRGRLRVKHRVWPRVMLALVLGPAVPWLWLLPVPVVSLA